MSPQLLICKFAVFTCVSFILTDASRDSLARSLSRPFTSQQKFPGICGKWQNNHSLSMPIHANISWKQYFSIYFVFFFSRLTLNSSAVQLPFTTDVQKKASCIFSHIFLLPPRSVPHNNYAHSSNRTFNSLWHHLGWGANRAYGKAGIRNPGPEPETEPEPEPEPELKLRPG